MNGFASSRTLHGSPITVIGRVANLSGQVADRILEGTAILKVTIELDAQRLVQRPSDLARDFSDRTEQALAFVAIGFGRAPVSDFNTLLWKGDFDEAEHPRVPAGSPKGGEFSSARETSDADNTVDNINNQNTVLKDLSTRVAKRAARKALRNRLVAGLKIIAGALADLIPGAGEIFDGYEFGQTIADGIALEKDVAAAKAFVEEGPRTLEQLQMDVEDRSFSSFDAFKKDDIGKYYGSAGSGYEYHHIVEQGTTDEIKIPAYLLQSTGNVVRIPRLLHEEISAEYGSYYKDTGKTLREWLSSQPYEVRRTEGLRVMRDLGIIK